MVTAVVIAIAYIASIMVGWLWLLQDKLSSRLPYSGADALADLAEATRNIALFALSLRLLPWMVRLQGDHRRNLGAWCEGDMIGWGV
jgi:hypothetical protein